jgi:hypothetical protein
MMAGRGRPDRAALAGLAGLAVSLALVGCGPDIPGTTPEPPPGGDVVSVSAESLPAYVGPCELNWTVTITADDQIIVAGEWSQDDERAQDSRREWANCSRDESETSGEAPAGTFEQVAALVSAERYDSLDDELYPSGEIMDGSYHYVTVQTVDQTQTKGGHQVGTDGPQAFVDVYSTLWDAAIDAGLWGS